MKDQQIPETSLVCKRILIPFFLNPLSVLNEINISSQISSNKSTKIPSIKLLLNNESINEQLIPNEYFHKTKFRNNWPFTGIVQPGEEEDDENDSADSDDQMTENEIDEVIEDQINE